MIISDATLPLQQAVRTALITEPLVAEIIGGRVYDNPAPGSPKPYVSIGPSDVIPNDADCYQGAEISMQIDAWSVEPSSVEVKRLAAAIRAALHQAELPLTEDQRLVLLEAESTRFLVEPDGLTKHAVITLRALTEPVN